MTEPHEPQPTEAAPARVLHVVESFGGGTASAVLQYVRSTPEVSHHLIRRVRQGEFAGDGELARFSSVRALPAGAVDARRAIRRAVREVGPSVIHAHSSFGGAFARLSVRARAGRPLVYTPHGYSFERRDISGTTRFGFRTLEWLLTRNTTLIAACAPREAALARRLGADVTYVPNVAVIPDGVARRPAAQPLVAGGGRLSPARDPLYFLDAVRRIRSRAPGTAAVWIGDGPAEYREALDADGVRVTGWLTRREALDELSRATVYLHTGAWDGFPMSVLEAAAIGVPALVRSTPAFDHAPREVVVHSPVEMAFAAGMLIEGRDIEHRVRDAWRELLTENTEAVQRDRLLQLYGCGAQVASSLS